MANTIQVRRGSNASLPTLNSGEFGFSTDTCQVYIGDGAANHELDFAINETKTTISSDTTWTDIVPAGYILETMIFDNKTANEAILNLETTGYVNIFSSIVFAASTITTLPINRYFSSSVATSLNLNDTGLYNSWNSASFTIILKMKRL